MPEPTDRLAALEEQVARLTERLVALSATSEAPPAGDGSDPTASTAPVLAGVAPTDPPAATPHRVAVPVRAAAPTAVQRQDPGPGTDGAQVDRRRLLLRGGAVLAAAAGAAGLGAPPAAAAEGDPVLAGRATEAGTATTTLSGGTGGAPTLVVANAATRAADGGTYSAPALRLPAPSDAATLGLDLRDSTPGDLASGGDQLWYAHARQGTASVVGSVYTSAFANHLAFVTPRRVLDTRRAGPGVEAGAPNDGRSRVVAGRFDAAGRLVGGTALVLDLSGLLTGEQAGVLGNLTVVGPTATGFLSVYPTAPGSLDTTGQARPAVSSLNYVRGTPALANFAVVAFQAGNRVSVYTTTTTHVLFDVVAFSVLDPFSTLDPGDGTALRAARLRPRAATG